MSAESSEDLSLELDRDADAKLKALLDSIPEKFPALPEDVYERGLITMSNGVDMHDPLTTEQREDLKKFMHLLWKTCVPAMRTLEQNIVGPGVVPRGTMQAAAMAAEGIKTLLRDPTTVKYRYDSYLNRIMNFLYGRARMADYHGPASDLCRMPLDVTLYMPDGVRHTVAELPEKWKISPARVGWMTAVGMAIAKGGVRRKTPARKTPTGKGKSKPKSAAKKPSTRSKPKAKRSGTSTKSKLKAKLKAKKTKTGRN